MYRNHQDEDHLNNESFTSYHEDLMNQRERESSPVFSESSTSLDEFNCNFILLKIAFSLLRLNKFVFV